MKPSHLWPSIVVVTALAYGTLCILPNVWQRFDAEYPFQGIEMMGSDQEHYYVARIREIQDGYWGLGSIYFHDQKNLPYTQPPLAEWIVGGISRLLGLDIAHTFIATKFLLAALLFVAITWFCFSLSARPWVSLLATSSLLFCGFLFASHVVFWNALKGLPLGSDFLRFSRLMHPLFSNLLFFSALALLVRWTERRSLRPLMLAAVFVGCSLYVYPYTSAFLLITLSLLMLAAFARRDRRQLHQLSVCCAIIGIFAAPYILHVYGMYQLSQLPEFTERLGFVYTHQPLGGYWIFVFLFLAVCAGRRISRFREFIIVLAVSGIIALNQQVITGISLVPHHFHWYIIHPLAVLTSVIFIVGILGWFGPNERRFLSIRIALFVTVFAMTIVWGIKFQRESYLVQRHTWGMSQRMAGAIHFLATQPSGSVVYTPDFLADLVPVYTSLDVYTAGNANISCLCSTDRLRQAYFFELWFQGLDPRNSREEFRTNKKSEISAQLYAMHYRETLGSYDRIPIDAAIKEADNYVDYAALTLTQKLQLQKLDFIALPQNTALHRNAQMLLKNAVEVYRDDAYHIWSLSAAGSR